MIKISKLKVQSCIIPQDLFAIITLYNTMNCFALKFHYLP